MELLAEALRARTQASPLPDLFVSETESRALLGGRDDRPRGLDALGGLGVRGLGEFVLLVVASDVVAVDGEAPDDDALECLGVVLGVGRRALFFTLESICSSTITISAKEGLCSGSTSQHRLTRLIYSKAIGEAASRKRSVILSWSNVGM